MDPKNRLDHSAVCALPLRNAVIHLQTLVSCEITNKVLCSFAPSSKRHQTSVILTSEAFSSDPSEASLSRDPRLANQKQLCSTGTRPAESRFYGVT